MASVVETASGRLRGLKKQGVVEFRGVPFARPPEGEARFQPPRPVQPWTGVRDADRWPMPAVQELNPLMGVEQCGDDCLYLNIWVPEGDGPFPVMLWYHGGGYLSGSPSQLLYNGARLAREQGVIVVNASYRLGALGYGWFRELAPSLEAPGNAGLRDQLAALQWVSDNIAGFGGDADNITLFGESAGGFSVATLLAVPQASGLFRRAIVQSGAADYVLSPEEAGRISETIVQALPGQGAIVDRMIGASPKDWVRAQRQGVRQLVQRGLRQTTPQFGMTLMPVVDGDLLPELPLNAIAAGSAKDKPLLAGVCRDEWHLFQYAPPFNGNAGLDRLRAMESADIRHRFRRALPEHGDQAYALYQQTVTPDPRRAPLDVFSAMESDRIFRMPTLRLLDAQVAAGGDSWGFQFNWEVEAFGLPLGACHVVDVPLVFGLVDTPVGQLFTGGGDAAETLSAGVRKVWGDFARGTAPPWESWSAGRRAMGLAEQWRMQPLFDQATESFWDDVIPRPRV